MSTDSDRASMAAQHPTATSRASLKVAPTDGSVKFNTIRMPMIPSACWRLNHTSFAFELPDPPDERKMADPMETIAPRSHRGPTEYHDDT